MQLLVDNASLAALTDFKCRGRAEGNLLSGAGSRQQDSVCATSAQ